MSQKLIEARETINGLLKQFKEAAGIKPKSIGQSHQQLARYAGVYPTPLLAVEICDRKFTQATEDAIAQGQSNELVMRLGKIAFCAALPKLTGATNIRDFIACVTYAMSLDIIPSREGTKLLYAAQVAYGAIKRKRSKKSTQSPLNAPQAKETTPAISAT
jgi:hypothetical protein